MQSWSFKRFSSLFAIEVKESGLRAILHVAIMLPIYLLLAYKALPSLTEQQEMPIMVLQAGGFIAVSILALIAAISAGAFWASRAFKSYNKRESAWMQIMLPASQAEKFVVKYLWHGLIVPLGFIAVILVAFILITMFWPTLSWSAMGVESDVADFVDYLFSIETSQWLLIIGHFLASWLSSIALFFAGSAVLKRVPFLLTLVVVVPATVIINSKLVGRFGRAVFDRLSVNAAETHHSLESFETFAMLSIGFNFLWIVLAIVVAWFFYRRRTVP